MRERAIFGVVQRAVRSTLLQHVPTVDAVPEINKLDEPKPVKEELPPPVYVDEVQTHMPLPRSQAGEADTLLNLSNLGNQELAEVSQPQSVEPHEPVGGLDWDSWNITHMALQPATTLEESSAIKEPTEASEVDIPEPTGDRLPVLRLVGQLSNRFILAEWPAGLYILDQHAAD